MTFMRNYSTECGVIDEIFYQRDSLYSVSQKNPPRPAVFLHFLTNGSEF